MQAKVTTCYDAIILAVWLKNFVFKLNIVDSFSMPMKIYCDNASIVFYSENNEKSKWLETNWNHNLVVRDKINEWQTVIEHINI